MKILAIETSCDETGISIIEASGSLLDTKFSVLSDQIASQADLHAEYGGVYPNLAKNEHIKNLPLLLERSLKDVNPRSIDCIAVTHGPGLAPALWAGVNFASELSKKLNVPVVPVNHMEGHIFSALLCSESDFQFSIFNFQFPTLALLVSGGHTQLILMQNWFEYELLGETRDDAVGEAFDKVARMLGLPYPGGPQISKLALKARSSGLKPLDSKLPRPMLNTNDYDFSFSGLKTAVLQLTQKISGTTTEKIDFETKQQIAREFEDAAIDVLIEKTARAIMELDAKTLLIAGGVSANTHLQKRFKDLIASEYNDVSLHLPPPSLTGDNALMIAIAGYFRAKKGEYIKRENLEAHSNLTLY